MSESGPLYQYIEFCRNAETLWHKLQSGHWDWLGRKPDGQFVLGRPRRGGSLVGALSLKVKRGDVEEGNRGVRWHQWNGVTNVEPSSEWVADEQAAKDRFDQLVEHYENPEQCPVLARVWRVENGLVVDERFIAQTPPPNYQ